MIKDNFIQYLSPQGCNHFQLWCEAQEILVSSEFALLSVHINQASCDGHRGRENPQPKNRDEKMNQKMVALGTHWLRSLYVPRTSFQTSNTVGLRDCVNNSRADTNRQPSDLPSPFAASAQACMCMP